MANSSSASEAREARKRQEVRAKGGSASGTGLANPAGGGSTLPEGDREQPAYVKTSVQTAKMLAEAEKVKSLRRFRATQSLASVGKMMGPVSFVMGAQQAAQAASDLVGAKNNVQAREAVGRLTCDTVRTVGNGAETVAAAAAASKMTGLTKTALVAGKISGIAGGVAGVGLRA
jgi:hypothetical protein